MRLVSLAAVIGALATAATAQSIGDAPFAQDRARTHAAAEKLLGGAPRHIAPLGRDGLLATRSTATARWDGETWRRAARAPLPPEHLIAANGTAYAAAAHTLLRYADDHWSIVTEVDTAIQALAPWGDTAAYATAAGVYTLEGRRRATTADAAPIAVLLHIEDSTLRQALGGAIGLAGSEEGLYAITAEEGAPLRPCYPADATRRWAPRDVYALAATPGAIWFGAREGAGRFTADGGWQLFTGNEGLPVAGFTDAAANDQSVWLATRQGAVVWRAGTFAYRAGPRWLPGDTPSQVALSGDGTAWFTTTAGLGSIAPMPTTLADKAEHYEQVVDTRHRRDGLVVACTFEEPGDPTSFTLNVGDNDGGRTSKYGTAQAFRYAATGDPDARQRAQAVFKTLQFLVDITPMPGFPARSILPVAGHQDPNIGYGEAFNLRRQRERDPLWKNITPRWPKSADGNYYWKCDTSSDEIVSHFFFLDSYYAHVAESEEEVAEVRALTRAMADHLVDNGFKLIDHDGKPTRWANWSPEKLNTLRSWPDRGLKSMQMLSFLAVAEHITGDTKYAEAAAYLRDTHQYHINAIRARCVFPPAHVVPWDDNQALSCLYTLLRHTDDPELLLNYQAALYRNWLFVERHTDAFYNAVFLAHWPQAPDPILEAGPVDRAEVLGDAVAMLRHMPHDLVNWPVQNTHRLDITLDPTGGGQPDDHGWGHDADALPIDEIQRLFLSGWHFNLDDGGDGTTEMPGTQYLLPYWMLRYHGLIEAGEA